MKTVLILALMGQYCVSRGVQQRCYTASTYATTYAAPTYNYNQTYAVPYVEKVKFVAVEQPGYDYYAALAAASSRSYERFQEYAQVPQQAAMTYSIPSPVQVAQQPVYQAPVPAKVAPDPVQATPQYPVAQATPQQPFAQATPQQPLYQAPAPVKAPPPQLQTPAKNPTAGDDGTTPPPIIQRGPVNYSASMGADGEVTPPPPAPRVPQAYNQPPIYLQQNPVISSVNSHFLSVLTKNCASCHTGLNSKGGFQIFDYPGRLAGLSQDDLQNIANQVASRKMPFKRVMPDSDRQAVLGMLSGNVSSLVSR